MNTYGYIRVSTKDQHTDRQRKALRQYGVPVRNIFEDKQSGKDFDRPAWTELLGLLEEGDALVIKSIDRLGRNYTEVLEQWRFLTDQRGVSIVVLDMPVLDTLRKTDLTATLISDIVLQILSYVAETERSMMKVRQAEGIAAAKAKGVRFGRPAKAVPDTFAPLYNRWKAGEITRKDAALEAGVSASTFTRLVHKHEQSLKSPVAAQAK